MQKLTIIDQIAFFQELDDEEKETVANLNLRIFKFDPRAPIIRKDDTHTHLFILIKGTATVVGPSGEPLAVLKPGDVFGEISFLVALPRTATVVANMQAVVLVVDKKSFQTLKPSTREKIKDKLIDVIIRRLVEREQAKPSLDLSFSWDS